MAKTPYKKIAARYYPNKEWQNINFCVPITVGLVVQEGALVPDGELQQRLQKSITYIVERLKKCFGDAGISQTKKQSNSSDDSAMARPRLIVMVWKPCGENNKKADTEKDRDLTEWIWEQLKGAYSGAQVDKVVTEDLREIKKYCWLTIAAWDGVIKSSCGETVCRLLSSEYDEAKSPDRTENAVLNFPQNCPVYQIVLPIGETPESIDYQVREIYPHLLERIASDTENTWFDRDTYHVDREPEQVRYKQKRKDFEEEAAHIRSFNDRVVKLSPSIGKWNDNVYDLLDQHSDEACNGLPGYVKNTVLRQIYYDVTSMGGQTKQKRWFIILLGLSCAGLIACALYADLELCRWWMVVFGVLMAAAFGLYWFMTKRTNAHNDYLFFRVLAEGMRVQTYWYGVGYNVSVGDAYSVKYQSDMRWAIRAFHAIFLGEWLDQYEKKTDSEDKTMKKLLAWKKISDYDPPYDILTREWLGKSVSKHKDERYDMLEAGGQLKFYHKRIGEFCQSLRKDHKKQQGCLIAWFVVVLVTVSMVMTGFSFILPLGSWSFVIGEKVWLFLITLCNIFMLAVTADMTFKADEDIVTRYHYGASLAQLAVQACEAVLGSKDESDSEAVSDSEAARIRAIFAEFGREALEENAEWQIIKNNCKPEVYTG